MRDVLLSRLNQHVYYMGYQGFRQKHATVYVRFCMKRNIIAYDIKLPN